MTNKDLVEYLVGLADDLAASATTFTGQGYSTFIRSREFFIRELERLIK